MNFQWFFFKILNSAEFSIEKLKQRCWSRKTIVSSVKSIVYWSDIDNFSVNCRNVNLKLVLWFPFELTISKNSILDFIPWASYCLHAEEVGKNLVLKICSWILSRAGCVGDPTTSLLRKLRHEVMNLKAALSSGPCLTNKQDQEKHSVMSCGVDVEYTFPGLQCP